MECLPSIHSDVRSRSSETGDDEFGRFGFYNGVTNMTVRIRHAYETDGLQGVEAVVRRFADGGDI